MYIFEQDQRTWYNDVKDLPLSKDPPPSRGSNPLIMLMHASMCRPASMLTCGAERVRGEEVEEYKWRNKSRGIKVEE